MRIPEWMLFLRTWLRNPRRVGALAPSSPALAALITADIPRDGAAVIELGAGTGVFTRATGSCWWKPIRLSRTRCDIGFPRCGSCRWMRRSSA
ncbi:phospholipid methyltransferase [Burkholderia contaminans]|uniref:Phospholipid methyltransferase n=1 Tax=Burkholderia contaminans TaxID=488447 RepID=A0A6P3BPD3_9BURK|nr:phospholipid methyltransferase [Burkholderia contaminans]